MRKLLLVVGLAVCMAGIASADMLSNTSFEEDMTDWLDWGSGSGSGTAGYLWTSANWADIMEDGTAHTGDKYVNTGFIMPAGYKESWAWGYSLIYRDVPIIAGNTYIISAWVRFADADGAEDVFTEGTGINFEWRTTKVLTGGGRPAVHDVNGDGERNNDDKVFVRWDLPKDGEWMYIEAAEVAPEGADVLTPCIVVNAMDISLDIDDIHLRTNRAYDPTPADGGKALETLDILTWKNPDPNHPSEPITCDVYFTDNYPEAGMFEGDPNFLNYVQQIADDEPIASVSIPQALVFGQTYYWRVDCTDPATGTTVVGYVWEFTVANFAPDVEAGDDVYVWLTDGSVVVNLSPTVTDDDHPDPPAAFTVEWALTAGDTQTISITDPLVENAEVTLTAVGDYELELAADDSELSGSDTITIHVYENACDATKGAGIELPATDINEDCAVNIVDLALLAGNLMDCMSYDCP